MKTTNVWHRAIRSLIALFLDFRFYLGRRLLKLRNRLSSDVPKVSHGWTQYDAVSIDRQHKQTAALTAWLIGILRRYPYWQAGHLYLAEFSLADRELECAYASIRAVLELPGGHQRKKLARHALGKYFLAVGKHQLACQTLQAVAAELPNRSSVAEDLAAAYMALGDHHSAHSALSKFETIALSPEAVSVRQHLERSIK